jgi:hypothetical protein
MAEWLGVPIPNRAARPITEILSWPSLRCGATLGVR